MDPIMLEESLPSIRKPTTEELAIVAYLAQKSNVLLPSDFYDELQVAYLNDGGMGSLRLYSKSVQFQERRFGSQASEIQFNDVDGIPVLVTLYLDQEGDLFELDVWKVDFSPLVSFDGALEIIQREK